jgi:hypothetical protein
MLPAADLLRSGGEEKARKNLILRFFLVADHLLQSNDAARRSSALATAIQIDGATLTQYSSGFLYHLAYHAYEIVERQEPCLSPVTTRFLANLFDSFFDLLGEGDSVSLPAPNNFHLLLPNLRISIPASVAKHVRLSKRGSAVVLQDEGSGSELARLPVQGQCNPVLPVTARSALVLSLEPFVDDGAVTGKIADLTHAEALKFVGELQAALNFIRVADEGVAASIDERIRWYFPIKTPDKTAVHNSFTINTLPGAIFLSESYSYVNLGEALVHEFYHNELSWAMMIGAHIKPGDEARLYSPWREDPRPLYGLYHGIYVFAGLLEFLTAALQKPALSEHHAHCRARRHEVYFQARTALAQVPSENLTKSGVEVLYGLQQIVECYGRDLKLADKPLPEPQRKHWENWMRRNSQFQHNVTVPPGIQNQEEKLCQRA